MQWLVKSNTLFYIHIEYKKANHKKKTTTKQTKKKLMYTCYNENVSTVRDARKYLCLTPIFVQVKFSCYVYTSARCKRGEQFN